MRAVLVEGDVSTAEGIALTLRMGGGVIDIAEDGEEALELLRHYDYGVAMVALGLPGMDGFEVVRRMRAARIGVPAIMLAGQVRSQVRVRAFSVGADDFVTTPFDPSELIARMHALVRRSKGYSQPTVCVGPLLLNLDSHIVQVNGTEVRITGKEYAILELLVLRKGIVLSKEVFLNHLYGGMDEPEAKIIDVFICKLRKKLAVAGGGDLISTVWGRGYILRDPGDQSAWLDADASVDRLLPGA